MSDVKETCGTCVACGTGYPEHCSVVELKRQVEELILEEAEARAQYDLARNAFEKAKREWEESWDKQYSKWEATRERCWGDDTCPNFQDTGRCPDCTEVDVCGDCQGTGRCPDCTEDYQEVF